MSDAVDEIQLTKTVLFVGDYFSLMSTVVLSEELREEGEDDDDFAIRLASVLLKEHYGWDVEDAATVSIGIVEE
jgi:hypothetical protein